MYYPTADTTLKMCRLIKSGNCTRLDSGRTELGIQLAASCLSSGFPRHSPLGSTFHCWPLNLVDSDAQEILPTPTPYYMRPRLAMNRIASPRFDTYNACISTYDREHVGGNRAAIEVISSSFPSECEDFRRISQMKAVRR